MNAYLVAYNLACALGWAYVLFLVFQVQQSGEGNIWDGSEVWRRVAVPLTYVQTAALLEVVHSLVGLVRSPFHTALIQVSSRIFLLWGITRQFTVCQAHWSTALMVGAWASTEVPRYLFYCFGQFMQAERIPFPLFWLRYSLFMVLYPAGISGEILQMYTSLSVSATSWPMFYRLTLVILALYVPGGPFMIMNMWGNRKNSFKKRAQALNPRPPAGVSWPEVKPGDRGSTETNRAIFTDSVKGIDADAMEVLEKTRNWRFGYAKNFLTSCRAAFASKKKALIMAEAGLASAHKRFTFIRNGKEQPLGEAMRTIKSSFKTGVIKGSKPKPSKFQLEVPYGGKDPSQPYYKFRKNNDVLSGSALSAQLKKWVAYGSIEQSCADAIEAVANNQEWLDLSDRYFVILGATSAMGPLEILLKHGANVIAIDLDRPFIWEKIFSKVKDSCGTVIFPYKEDCKKEVAEMTQDELTKVSGSNLLEQTPEICNWLKTVAPGKQLVVGNYTYLDGALHVQLSVACDAIMQGLCEERKDTALAFLCTPTDVHVIPEAAAKAMQQNEKAIPGWMSIGRLFSKKVLQKNYLPPVDNVDANKKIYLVDGLSVAQGPNYALAKRMQHWRAIVARERGHTVSTNIAPSTATKSVVHAVLFAAAYGGMHKFKPMEVLYQETSNAVMGALLLHDVCNPKGWSYPSYKLDNPYELFEYGSFHGGVWRCGYKLDSIGEMSVLQYLSAQFGLHITAVLAALGATGFWVATGKTSL